MKNFIPLFVLPVIVGLSACNSTELASFEEMLDSAETLADHIEGADITPVADIPTSGSAKYEGYVGIELDSSDSDLIGEIEINVAFAQDEFNGSIFNLVDEDEGRFNGSIALENGTLDRGADLLTEHQLNADLDGEITGSGGDPTAVTGTFEADFGGDNAEFIGGEIEGTAVNSSGVINFEGVAIAETP